MKLKAILMGSAILVSGFVPGFVPKSSPAAQPDPLEVLGNQSPWRFHASWRRPATVAEGKYNLGGGYKIPDPPGTRWILSSFTEPTPPPPTGWMAADFDDSNWPRHAGPRRSRPHMLA